MNIILNPNKLMHIISRRENTKQALKSCKIYFPCTTYSVILHNAINIFERSELRKAVSREKTLELPPLTTEFYYVNNLLLIRKLFPHLICTFLHKIGS